MEFSKFEKVTNLLIQQYKLELDVYNYVHTELFDKLWQVIEILLKGYYPESTLDYVYYPYILEDNKFPVTKDGVENEVETIKDLYNVMEMLKRDIEILDDIKVDDTLDDEKIKEIRHIMGIDLDE